jgi:DNA polymerase III delta prime subunit
MNSTRPSIFRNALQVSPERIANLSDRELNQLMGHLLRAQAYRCGSPQGEIRTNTEIKASDNGCDGWTAKPVKPDDWLGSTDTCWQFKAGEAGEPARLVGEVTKRIPTETLVNGGSFVVVASGSVNGKKGEDARRKNLVLDAVALKIPTSNIWVMGSERISIWCNQHPAVAAYWAGRPEGLWTLHSWLNSDEHQVPWQASEAVNAEILTQSKNLDFEKGNIYHLHIHGYPGVGKTRFALELCRKADWCEAVIYIRNAADLRLEELISGAIADEGVQLMVVADEVQPNQLRLLRDAIGQGNGEVRLITIGHCPTPDPSRIPAIAIKPLAHQQMTEVIKGWHPTLPQEHIDFVVRFADGYVRLAKLAADAVVRNPAMNVRELLSQDEIRVFLDRMLGTGDRQPLHVVAVLTSVGWADDKQGEGQAIAHHFGLDWNQVRYAVEDFHRHFNIAPRGGRYRYISPTPLGIHLAVEAWNTYPDLIRSLPEVLPTEEARRAYFMRLQSIASNPYAREFAREELDHFFRLDDFIEAGVVRRWSALTAADPNKAARNILRALKGTSIEDRKRIIFDARREAVWALVRLAWRSSSFHDAVTALALLAEAENEKWANNASGEFIARFQIYLGGTATPYVDRLLILDELMVENHLDLTKLAIKALSQVGNRNETRMNSGPASDEIPEIEWYPHSGKEYLECLNAAIIRLRDIAKLGIPDIQDELVTAARDISILLLDEPIRGLVIEFLATIRQMYPNTRESLRRIIADILHREKEYWKKLPEEDIAELDDLHSSFEESSLPARLFQFVGTPHWDPGGQQDLTPLAKEFTRSPELLEEHWSWLTSGEAESGWRLGEALAHIDTKHILAELMPSFPGCGRDLRLLCSYIGLKRNNLGDNWYNRWIKSRITNDPHPEILLIEVAWRCGATEYLAQELAEIIRNGNVEPRNVGSLMYGRWSESLTIEELENLLQAIIDSKNYETAIGILGGRLRAHPEEAGNWDYLAVRLITSPNLIRSSHSYHWKEVASIYVPIHPSEIAAAILQEQAVHISERWFLEFSDAVPILRACAEKAPSEVWGKLESYLSVKDAYRFTSGFPRGIVDILPVPEIMTWISKQPEERAKVLAELVTFVFSSDDTLVSQILGEYGDNDRIAGVYFSNYLTGTWIGPTSTRWNHLAGELERISKTTSKPKLRMWSIEYAHYLREMEERDRRREEEEDIRGY